MYLQWKPSFVLWDIDNTGPFLTKKHGYCCLTVEPGQVHVLDKVVRDLFFMVTPWERHRNGRKQQKEISCPFNHIFSCGFGFVWCGFLMFSGGSIGMETCCWDAEDSPLAPSPAMHLKSKASQMAREHKTGIKMPHFSSFKNSQELWQ